MKTISKYLLLGALSAGFLTGCANDDDYDAPNADCINPGLTANKTVESLIAQATTTPTQYTGDDIIAAYVTSSDERGAFFKVISLQTLPAPGVEPVAFSISIDRPGLFTEGFVPGTKVYIKLKDLYYGIDFESLEVGAKFVDDNGTPNNPGDDETMVGRISEQDFRNRIFVSTCEAVDEDQLVQTMTIAEALNDDNINKLIELDNVQFTENSFGYTLYDEDAPTDSGNPQTIGGATNHLLVDAAGNSIVFRTSSFANFAGMPVPEGSGKVRGVLTKFLNTYQFLARYESDIMFETERLPEPFFFEDFQDAVDNTDFNFPGWYNIIEAGTRKWSEQTFQGTGYAEFSSFGSGNASNVAWLVTPAINMDAQSNESMSFMTAQHHLDGDTDGNKLEVYILTSFDGTDIVGATKVDITDMITLPTSATAWYQFVNSGSVDLSSYTGNIHIAFKFTGSGTNTALDGAFQIDNLRIVGN